MWGSETSSLSYFSKAQGGRIKSRVTKKKYCLRSAVGKYCGCRGRLLSMSSLSIGCCSLFRCHKLVGDRIHSPSLKCIGKPYHRIACFQTLRSWMYADRAVSLKESSWQTTIPQLVCLLTSRADSARRPVMGTARFLRERHGSQSALSP